MLNWLKYEVAEYKLNKYDSITKIMIKCFGFIYIFFISECKNSTCFVVY